jgi:iron complex transport system permease protein
LAVTVLNKRASAPYLVSALRLSPLPLLLLVVLFAGTLYGSTSIPAPQTLHILLFKLGLYTGHRDWSAGDESIVWDLRLPRVIAAALVGSSLAVAGSLFQAVLRNPLADPYVIGTAAGAQLGVTVALVLSIGYTAAGFGSIQLFAFAGALLTVLFVYALARTAGRTPIVTLILAGFVVSSFLISGATFLMMATGRTNQVVGWTMGSLDVSDLSQIGITGPIMVLAAGAALVLWRQLDVMLLGEDAAGNLGVRIEMLKLVAIMLGALLTALAVSLAGIIPFVGLVVPHAVRLVYGPAHRILIPAAGLAGAVFVVLADLLSRVLIAPTPVPLGVVTVVVGAPFFLHLLRRSRREYGL